MDEFTFKYIPEEELNKIVKEVKRARRKKNEEKQWKEYLERKNLRLTINCMKKKEPCLDENNINNETRLIRLCDDSEKETSVCYEFRSIKPFTIVNHNDSGLCEKFKEDESFNSFDESSDKQNKIVKFLHPICDNSSKNDHIHLHNHHYLKYNQQHNFNTSTAAAVVVDASESNKLAKFECNQKQKQTLHQHQKLPDNDCESINVCGGCIHDKYGSSFNSCSVNSSSNTDLQQLSVASNDCGGNEIPTSKKKVSVKIDKEHINENLSQNLFNINLQLVQNNAYPDKLEDNITLTGKNYPFTPANSVISELGKQSEMPSLHLDRKQSLFDEPSLLPFENHEVHHRPHKVLSTLSITQEENFLSDKDQFVKPDNDMTLVTNEVPIIRDTESKYLIDNNNIIQSIRDTESNDSNNDYSVHNQQLKNQVVLNGELKIRIDNLKIKILTALNKTISICHKNNDRYDNEADSERKIKRANEFVTRFSRNYLYQLRRQIEIMKRLNLNQSCAQAFYQKMFISYQLSLQALQTCQTFLPDTSKLSSDKLVEFIELFLSLLELSKNQLGDTSESDEIRKLCVSLINILKNNVQNQECTAASNNSLMSHNSTNVNHKLTKSSKIKIKNRKSPKKLSMYASNGDLPSNWKKTSATLAKKKFGLPNKNISSNLIKNQKNSNDDKNNGEIVSEDNKYKQSVVSLMNNEDNNKPSVNITINNNNNNNNSNTDNDKGHNKIPNYLHTLPALQISTVIENCPDVDDDNLELPKNTEERTKVFLLFDKLSEIILQGREENENLKLDKEYDPEKHSQISEIEIKKVVQQIQEIYVQSESLGLTRNSLDEKCFLENSNNNLDIDKKNNSRKTSKYPNNVHFTSIKFNEEKYNSLNNQKHSNDQDVFPCIELNISDKEYQSVVEYRNSFLNYTSNSPVYGKFDERWTIVRRLADDLLSTLLSDVCKELEVNALIQKMYSLEFATQFHVTT